MPNPRTPMFAADLVQVAGIIDQAELDMLQQCGVRYLGFPLRLPIHNPDLTDDEASQLIRQLQPPVFGVVIIYLDRARAIADLCRLLGTRIVQLHGDIDVDELKRLKTLDPDLVVIKSLVVGLYSEAELASMIEGMSSFVDAYITDTFDPVTGASGATGRRHEWGISRRLVEHSDRPIILAGGLTPDNVKSAILAVRPAGVDVHTGVEDAAGRKSREKVERFVKEAEAGFRMLQNEAR
jgi:phosphoribosylanthranilate isomerase